MTWLGLLIFTVGNILTRSLGMFVLSRRVGAASSDATWTRVANLVPLAIVTAVFAVQTFSSRGNLGLDPRVVGVSAAGLAAWKRAPMVVVVVIAAGVTAGLRAFGF